MPGFAPVPGQRLTEQDPRGRFDVMAARLARHGVSQIEQRTGVDLWERGLGDVAEELIREYIPDHPFTAVEVCRAIGILPPAKRISRAPGTRAQRGGENT
jgi:hypothetical protein